VQGLLDPRTLTAVGGDVAGLPDGLGVLLVPDVGGRARTRLIRTLTQRAAVAGPARPWLAASTSYLRALRALDLRADLGQDATYDTEQHLADLVLAADREAVADLRARVLAPLEKLRPATRQKLAETLRAWLLHQGRRDDVAAALFVHPQTVRYRMGQIRELYGDRLEDPETVRDLTIALA
jgi:DNA-binding PucR family transcriptional regulator